MNKFGNDNGTYLLKGYRSSDIGILHPLKQNRNSKLFSSIFLENFKYLFTISSNKSLRQGSL